MEGRAAADTSVSSGSSWQKLFSRKGFAAVRHYAVMNVISVQHDILLRLLIAETLMA